jgi:hypothetical protein
MTTATQYPNGTKVRLRREEMRGEIIGRSKLTGAFQILRSDGVTVERYRQGIDVIERVIKPRGGGLDRVDDRMREALRLFETMGATRSSVAEKMGIPVFTLDEWLKNARQERRDEAMVGRGQGER